jgi:hypothetical protein
MKTVRFLLLAALVVAAQGVVWGQTITFNGSVPATYSVLDGSNATVALTDATFTSAIGKNTLTEATKVIRLRSNDVYKLSAAVGSLSNIGSGVATVASNTASAIQIGDIGFGISAIDATGASVVMTVVGELPAARTDTVVTVAETGPDFNYTSSAAVAGRMTTHPFPATLHDIGSVTQILSGDRISASGDNGSTDNFLAVSLKFGYLPQYFTVESAFSFVVTLTIGSA